LSERNVSGRKETKKQENGRDVSGDLQKETTWRYAVVESQQKEVYF